MKRSIRIIAIFMILFISISLLYAGGSVESGSSIDGRMYFLSKNTVNNKNKAMKLDVTSIYNTNTPGLVDSWNATTPDQGLFRLMVTLYSTNQPDLYMKISSNNDWKFIHEDNPSYTRPFGINAFKYTNTFNDVQFIITWQDGYSGYSDATLVTNDATNGADYYLFKVPTGAKKSSTGGWGSKQYVIPQILTDMDFCVTLPEYNGALHDGYYYTDLHYEITNKNGVGISYLEHAASGSNITADGQQTMSGDFRIWGYVGEYENDNSTQYVFNIVEAPYTYNVDLKQESYFNVANIQFNLDMVVDSTTNPTVDADYTRYTVYISPGPEYNSINYTASDYNFKKLDTEKLMPRQDSNTVYYDIFKNSSGTPFDSYAGHPSVYKISATYTPERISNYHEDGGRQGQDINMTLWRKSWHLDQPVYLRVTDESLAAEHLKGLYTTYLYFTLVVN